MLTCQNCGRESPDDFAFCPACAAPLSAAPAREVRKTVTVVFCDLSGSTSLGERLDPESLRDVQSRYFDAMRLAIERHGGTVEKYIGDAVMAVFGIPQLHEDDALRAARAAWDMREALGDLNKELERDRGVTVQVRIGVNTGEVVSGDPASGQALVTGDAVNVAARLEQHAPPGEVLLGEATHGLVRAAVDAEPVEPLEVKGKGEPVPAWRLLGVRDVASATVRNLDSPLVGRDRQRAQLRQAFEAAVADQACQLFTLLGPAGVGKSRLVQEFVEDLGESALVLRGRCLPYGEGITYFPVVEAIKQGAGLADFDLPDVVEAKVCSVLEGDEHQEIVCRHVAQLMGVGDAAAGEEIFWAIRRFFEASARERPLLLAFDDIHWGEPTFLDLVEHIADWSRGSPILLLCLVRSDLLDARPAWAGGKLNASTVSLEPLSEEEAGELMGNLLGSADLPADVAARIVETSEGNPLFVEQTLAMLIDDGVLVREGDRWASAGDLSEAAVPASIQALLAARLDRLSPQERVVLEAASVVGKEFFVGAVRHLVAESTAHRVPGDLMGLVRKELIRPERTTLPGEDAFRFRHLLIRDAAYEAIPKAQRAELHERFADWLEGMAGDAAREQEEIVAYHLEQAHAYREQLGPTDERTRAIGARAAARLASAGRRAWIRGDWTASANLMQRSLAAGPDGESARARILYELGEGLSRNGELREAIAAFDQASALARQIGDRSLQLLSEIKRYDQRTLADPRGTSTDELRATLESAVRELEELRDDAGLSTVWAHLAAVEWMPCRFATAEVAAHRAFDYARRSGEQRLLADPRMTLVAAQIYGVATPKEGLRTLRELREEMAYDRGFDSIRLGLEGAYLAMDGSPDEGRRLLEESIEIRKTLGASFSIAAGYEHLGHLESWVGDAVATERAFRLDYELLDEVGDEGHKSTAAGNLAKALWALERNDEAERYAEIAMNAAAEDDLASQASGRAARALVLATRRDGVEAERLAREAVAMFAHNEAPNLKGGLLVNLAEVLSIAGKRGEAVVVANEAVEMFEGKGNRTAAGTTRAFIDKLEAS